MLLNWLPNVCLICNKFGNSPIKNLCASCASEINRLENCCKRCSIPLPHKTNMCGECIKDLPSFDQSFSSIIYKAPADKLLHSMKDFGDLPSIRTLAEILIQQFENTRNTQDIKEPLPDLILPIPLHWRRQMHRGFNQSNALAQLIGEELKIKVETNWLRRTKHNQKQSSLKRKRRLTNLTDSFSISNHIFDVGTPLSNTRVTFAETRVALFDDVMTTGATMEAASKVLKKAGINWVEAWSIARTPKP